MSPRPINVEAKLAAFDRLPDDAIVDDPVAAALLGLSLDTFRRAGWNLARWRYSMKDERLTCGPTRM